MSKNWALIEKKQAKEKKELGKGFCEEEKKVIIAPFFRSTGVTKVFLPTCARALPEVPVYLSLVSWLANGGRDGQADNKNNNNREKKHLNFGIAQEETI